MTAPRNGTSVSTPTCSWTSHVGHRSRRQLAPGRPTWDIGLDANLLLYVPRGTSVSTPTCSWTSHVGHRSRRRLAPGRRRWDTDFETSTLTSYCWASR